MYSREKQLHSLIIMSGFKCTKRPYCSYLHLWGSPTLPRAQESETHFSPCGHQPLPQPGPSRAGLQQPTALPCLAMGPAELSSPVGLWDVLASVCCHHQIPQGEGCSQLPSFWMGLGWNLVARPCSPNPKTLASSKTIAQTT